MQVRERKKEEAKTKKLIKSLISKHEKTPESWDDNQDVQEVLLIEDDDSPVPSPVILPPEFYN